MSTYSGYELNLSEPWLIQFQQDNNQELQYAVNNVTEQVQQLAINEQNIPAQTKYPCSWSEHEKLTGDILNEAAKRASAETYKNICVYHPTRNHMPSQDGSNIRPDFIIAWSCDGVRRNTAVVDAKDHHGQVPRREYEKLCRDMSHTKATRGMLVLGKGATLSDSLRADIEKDGKVDIVQMQGDRTEIVRNVTQHIGKIIDKNFVPDDKHYQTYRQYVASTENSNERKPNPHGENATYTCQSTYHRFTQPRKQDGTIDERYAANQDRNKDGGPDMRMVHNKTTQAQQQHLNEDRSEDMRNKDHREDLIDKTGHRLNVDGLPDMRCKENQTIIPPNSSFDNNDSQSTENLDMRQKENRQEMTDSEGHHLNVDRSLDMRCKENQEDVTAVSSDESQLTANPSEQNETDTVIPTKNDGTPDMRHTVSKEMVASGVIESGEKLAEESSTISTGDNGGLSEGSTLSDIPTKSDGTADMRYGLSQDAVAAGEIGCDQVLGNDSEFSIGGAAESSSGIMDNAESGGGPLKADGTPDMRFSANQ